MMQPPSGIARGGPQYTISITTWKETELSLVPITHENSRFANRSWERTINKGPNVTIIQTIRRASLIYFLFSEARNSGTTYGPSVIAQFPTLDETVYKANAVISQLWI